MVVLLVITGLQRILLRPLLASCTRLVVLLAALMGTTAATADTLLPTLTAATLKYGTANWELQLIKAHRLDLKHGFELRIHEVSSPSAASVALQAGEADVAVQDWLWVLRQREQGRDFRYAPFSTAVGAVVVPVDSDIATLKDLDGRTLGVAGGDADKGWRLLRILYAGQTGKLLPDVATPRFGAPPLLSELALRGDIDALLTYWHYAARLEAKGFRTLMSVDQVLQQLGIPAPLPMLGWTFSGSLTQPPVVLAKRFLAASAEAKRLLVNDQSAWVQIRPWMRVASDTEFEALKTGFVQGIPAPLSRDTLRGVSKVAALYLGEDPASYVLDPKLFWVPKL